VADEDLLGIAEIAAAFGVQRNSAWRWSRRDDFPDPVARLSSGPIYRRRDIKRWYAQHNPQGGRPRKGAG
jgi:predicted DNA-binding transcriptional regulator AlpA